MKRILFACLLLAACTPSQTPQQIALLHELAGRPVTCEGKKDCDAKWNRAIEWVSRHNTEGIRTINDNLIATNMVSGEGKDPLRYPEFTVVRYATTAHAYKIDFTSYCEHGFECGETALKRRAGFVTWVMGPPPGVSISADGNRASKTIPTP